MPNKIKRKAHIFPSCPRVGTLCSVHEEAPDGKVWAYFLYSIEQALGMLDPWANPAHLINELVPAWRM